MQKSNNLSRLKPPLVVNTNKSTPRNMSSRHLRATTPFSPLYSSEAERSARVRHLSPFEQITSPISIYQSILPSFLQHKPKVEEKGSLRIPEPCKPSAPIESQPLSKQQIIEQIRQYVYGSQETENFILRIGEIELNSKDLSSLKPENEVTENVIDAFLYLLKERTRRRSEGKMMPVPVRDLLVGDKRKGVCENLLRYENIVFPINVGYWTIAICSVEKHSVVYYDPVGIECDDSRVKQILFRYLRREMGGVTGKNYIKKLSYEALIESDVYDHIDSGIYILKQAYNLTLNRITHITPSSLSEFRFHVLYNLFKHGTNVIY